MMYFYPKYPDMKRNGTILWLLILLAAFPLSAQEGFYGALTGSVNASYVTPQNTYGVNNAQLDYGFEGGYGGGLRLGYNWHEMYGFGFEAGYVSGGQQYRDRIVLGPGQPRLRHDKLVRLNYVTVTPLFRLSPKLEKNVYKQEQKLKFVMAIGFPIGIMTGANVEYQIAENDVPYPLTISAYDPVEDDKKLFEPLSVGLLLDLGFDWYITERFYINPGFRGQLTFTDINAKDYRNHAEYKASRLFMAGLQVSVGYFFVRK